MITKRTVYPGQPGTQKWINKYGSNLVCVRYKYDPDNQKKMITVELIDEFSNWKKNKKHIPKNKIVGININYGEVDLARKVKSFGGKWIKEKKEWEITYEAVQSLGLTNRIKRLK